MRNKSVWQIFGITQDSVTWRVSNYVKAQKDYSGCNYVEAWGLRLSPGNSWGLALGCPATSFLFGIRTVHGHLRFMENPSQIGLEKVWDKGLEDTFTNQSCRRYGTELTSLHWQKLHSALGSPSYVVVLCDQDHTTISIMLVLLKWHTDWLVPCLSNCPKYNTSLWMQFHTCCGKEWVHCILCHSD